MAFSEEQGAIVDFKHLEEFEDLIASLGKVARSKDTIAIEKFLEKCVFIIDEYQEQPHLLDPHLETLLGSLLTYVRNDKSEPDVFHLAFKIMYLLTKARGYKVIVRLMPHEVADVEPVMALLGHETTSSHQNWESRYMLLLWLSMVCMIPFDMSRLDNLNTEGSKRPITVRIIETGKKHLIGSDKSKDAAAYMLSRFLTRPDVKASYLPEFMDWAMQELHNCDLTILSNQKRAFGVLATLALFYKHGKREDLLPFAPIVLEKVAALKLGNSTNSALRKLGIKLIQRIALAFLKVRVASWRYQRGSRSLADNLTHGQPTGGSALGASGKKGEEDEDDYEIPDEMEEVIEQLLNGLRDDTTIVRWSAAKGIGRVTGRLPLELADEVVGSIMELFSLAETDMAWHGGCLSLAELGRRGLLLPQRLPDVVPVIIKALSFDEKRGHYSVGAHVRDAACYVCWAFARAYEPADMKPYVEDVARALVIVSIFDREVNVRRAAAAAFQENVGRQGQFPYGIDILTTCDYFAVGNATNCYVELSHFIGGFPEYTESLMDHLCKIKSNHWDESIRDLAAQGMSRLTPRGPQYVAETILPQILKYTLSHDLNVRHGAVLMTAWVVEALADVARDSNKQVTDFIKEDSLAHIKSLVPKYYDAKFLVGYGGELIRKAICCLLDKIAAAKLPFKDDPVIEVWQKYIDECLQYPEPLIQKAAATAIPHFFTEFYMRDDGTARPKAQEIIIPDYTKGLRHAEEGIRMGYAMALGAIPKFFVSGYFQDISTALIAASRIEKKDIKFAEARRDAVSALANLSCTLGLSDSPDKGLCAANIPSIYDALFMAMNDYTLDGRGDVGSWVREASMSALKEITLLIVRSDPILLQPEWCSRTCVRLVQQACEKIDRTRALAGEVLMALLYHEPEVPHVPNRKELEGIMPKEKVQAVNWAVPSTTFPMFIELLHLPTYAYHVMLGFTISAGGLTESIVRHSSSSLTNYINRNITDTSSCQEFAAILLKVCNEHVKQDRVMVPMMKMLVLLLANGSFDSLLDVEDPDFVVELLNVVKREVSKCGNPQKLLACVDVCCGLLQFKGNIRKKAISQLLIFMCYRYPIVRKNAANKLYETAMMYDDIIDEGKLDDVLSILSETLWDEPVDEIRPIRNSLCEKLGVPVPVAKSKAST